MFNFYVFFSRFISLNHAILSNLYRIKILRLLFTWFICSLSRTMLIDYYTSFFDVISFFSSFSWTFVRYLNWYNSLVENKIWMLCKSKRKCSTFSLDLFRVYWFTFSFQIHRIWDISAACAVLFVFNICMNIEMIFLFLCDKNNFWDLFFCSFLNDDTAFESWHLFEFLKYVLHWLFDDFVDNSLMFAFRSDIFSFDLDFTSTFRFDCRD